MKKYIVFILALVFLTLNSFYAQTTTTANIFNANLNYAKVFLNGAELTHKITVPLQKGINRIKIGNISSSLDEATLNIKIPASDVLENFSFNRNFLVRTEVLSEVNKLKVKIKKLKKKNLELNNQIYTLRLKENFLLANKKVTNEKNKISINELKKYLKYFTNEIFTIRNELTNYESQIELNKKQIDNLEQQISELSANKNNPTGELNLVINSSSKHSANINISYYTYSARWEPVYDVKVFSGKDSVELIYKAAISQNTGLNWKNLQLELSTNRPSFNRLPNLTPWEIDFNNYGGGKFRKKSMRFEAQADAEKASLLSNPISVIENQLSLEYKPNLLFNINSGEPNRKITLEKKKFPVSFIYVIFPKYSSTAYFSANIRELSKIQLLSGKAFIFLDNSYVSKTFLTPNNLLDNFNVPLGKDPFLTIKKTKTKDFVESKFLSSNVERVFKYKIEIVNRHNFDVNVEVNENYPISKTDEIKVKLLKTENAQIDKEKHILIWKKNMTAGQKFTIEFSFSVEYPKNKKIMNL